MSDIIPTSLAHWRAPAWATSSRSSDGEIVHTRTTDAVPTVDGEPLSAEAYLADGLEVVDGVPNVLRGGAPVVVLAGVGLTLAAAHNLGVALCNLVEDVEAIAGLEVTR